MLISGLLPSMLACAPPGTSPASQRDAKTTPMTASRARHRATRDPTVASPLVGVSEGRPAVEAVPVARAGRPGNGRLVPPGAGAVPQTRPRGARLLSGITRLYQQAFAEAGLRG